ncbi:mas-related G-protein coupled receptor member X2-like [Sorex araneus]|uniref:mas-related G-protein coupled receptor member X2-like n=1 Tax=Sorex araneus TaxID=42254 RepID=UPI002433575F|nr:mas-related G-protein coupled receptor member X2-like [Sorex araneus]
MDVTITAWVTESKLGNKSDWATLYSTNDLNFFIVNFLEFIISLVGLAGNAVVLWHLSFCMQRNAFSVYIFNLAGADFVFLFICTILSMKIFFKKFLFHFIPSPQVFFIMFVFAYVASLSILSAISTERCLSALKPIWYRCHRPKHMSSVVCALLWALSLLLTILRMEFCGYLFGELKEYLCKRLDFTIATWLIFSFVLLFGSSLVLLTRLLCGTQMVKLTRLYVTIGLTVLVFLLFGLPWGINWFLLYWTQFIYDNDSYKYKCFNLATELLSCVNSCVNPIIYFFVGSYRQQRRQQRRNLKLILQRALQDIPEEDGSQGSPPQETLEMSGNSHVS